MRLKNEDELILACCISTWRCTVWMLMPDTHCRRWKCQRHHPSCSIRWVLGRCKHDNFDALGQKVIRERLPFLIPWCSFLSPYLTLGGKLIKVSELKVNTFILGDTDFVLMEIKVCCLPRICSKFPICGWLWLRTCHEVQIMVKVNLYWYASCWTLHISKCFEWK